MIGTDFRIFYESFVNLYVHRFHPKCQHVLDFSEKDCSVTLLEYLNELVNLKQESSGVLLFF
jgi:hypothetical protein